MGSGTSKAKEELSKKQIEKYVKDTGFSASELQFLHLRFKSICKNKSSLSKKDIQENELFKSVPYINRLFSIMPKNESGDVNFDAFVRTAAIFRPGRDMSSKLRFLFNLFDYDSDDTLDVEELRVMISAVKPELNDDDRDEVVRQTTIDILSKGGDPRRDGKVHGAAFVSYAARLPGIEKLLVLNLADEPA